MTNNTYSINYNNKSNNTNTNTNTNISSNNNNTTTTIDNSDSTDTMLGLIKKLERCLICPENLQNPDRGTKLLLRIRILINQDNNNNNNNNSNNSNSIDNSNRVGSSNGISSSSNVGILYKSNIINQLLKNNSSILRNCNLTDEFLRVLLPLLR